MSESFETQYEDVLQNIEFAIIRFYREQPEITDWTAAKVLDSLIRLYRAEQQENPSPSLKLSDTEQALLTQVRAWCEWRLGREAFVAENEEGETEEIRPVPIRLDEMIACLKRVRRSVKRWTKEGGRRGYLDFVDGFFP